MKSKISNRRSTIINMTSGLLIGAFTATPSWILAQDTNDENVIRYEKLLDRFDRNGDGRIDDSERHHVRDTRNRPDGDRQDHSRRDRIRDHFDRNDNERLDPRERQHLRQFHDRLDHNNDGRIGKREWKAFRHHRANRDQ